MASRTRSRDRLDFARWLADRRSPTTARSIVNRIWQAYFGTGLVATAEDLGTQGEPPSHPELLDWLAVELMDHNWSLKHIHRLIVTSATYRQSSAVTPQLLGARSGQPAAGPRAAVSRRCGDRARRRARGQRAVESDGGRAERVSAGAGIPVPAARQLRAEDLERTTRGQIDIGGRCTRSASARCRTRCCRTSTPRSARSPVPAARRSNTPLQALTTLNEPLFVECARALAVKIVTEGGTSDAERLTYAVRRCLSREPQDDELKVLQDFLDQQKAAIYIATGPIRGRCWPMTTSRSNSSRSQLAGGTTPGRPGRLDGCGPRGVKFGRDDYEGVSRLVGSPWSVAMDALN